MPKIKFAPPEEPALGYIPEAAEPEQEVAAAPASKLAQSEPSFRLVLTPRLRAIVHAHRTGHALNAEISELWAALYEASGPADSPQGRTYGA